MHRYNEPLQGTEAARASPLQPHSDLRRAFCRQGLCAALAAAAAPGAWAHGAAHKAKAPVAAPEQKAWGIAGHAGAVTRVVNLSLNDNMRFTPQHLEVREGETLRLVLRNRGRMLHELVIGTRAELESHAALMLKFPNMEHEEPYMAHVAPAQRGEIIWAFNRVGDFEFACLIPGHYQAGMKGTIRVRPRAAA